MPSRHLWNLPPLRPLMRISLLIWRFFARGRWRWRKPQSKKTISANWIAICRPARFNLIVDLWNVRWLIFLQHLQAGQAAHVATFHPGTDVARAESQIPQVGVLPGVVWLWPLHAAAPPRSKASAHCRVVGLCVCSGIPGREQTRLIQHPGQALCMQEGLKSS